MTDEERVLRIIEKAAKERVTSLDLYWEKLTALPPEIVQLRHLKQLDLRGNQLTALPPEIVQLQNLTYLDLSNNQLTALPPEIGQLRHLRRLDLGGNQLTALPPPEIVQLQNLTYLDLSNNQLKALPPEIFQLHNLTHLDLRSNKLTALPPEIFQLHNLTELNLCFNQLTALPPEIVQLHNLTGLYLGSNQLTALPPEIVQLHNLKELVLGNNQLRALPPEIGQLSNLTGLYLGSNQLTALPPEIGQLHNLKELVLGNNQLRALPPEIGQLHNLTSLHLRDNQLTALPPEIGQLSNLKKLNFFMVESSRFIITDLEGLYLGNNPLTSPPPEILQQGREAVFAYLREQLQAKQTQWVSKLLIVGEGGVGKTSLLRALRGEPFNSQESTTHGIAIRTLELAHPTQAGVTMQLNAWDFGGQQIYHATHQFFLSNRSLFLLAWNARVEFEQGKLHYWLDTIKAVAPNSPILLVATHIDERTPELPESDLRQQYPQIKGYSAISSRTGAGIDTLQQLIADTAAQLPLMGEIWPLTWLNAAKAIRQHSREYITQGQLNDIMTAHKVDPDSQLVLAQWLHELGDILYFQDKEELRNIVILKPQWVIEYISKVLESQQVQDSSGIFTRAHMAQLWQDLEPLMREHFLRLMEGFDLSYRLRTESETSDVSLVVERLSLDPPNYQEKWDAIKSRNNCNEMSMKWKMKTLPAGIPTRFIAREHRFSLGIHWRKGALLADEPHAAKHLALVQAFPLQSELQLSVRGANPQNFFALLKDGIEVTLARFPGLEIKRTIPCPCGDSQPCRHEFNYQQLVKRYEKNKHAIECPECLEDISVIKLLLGLDLNPVQQSSGLEPNNLILSHVEQLASGQHNILAQQEELQAQLTDMRELTQREFTNAFHREQAKIESHCPNIFVLRPQEASNWKRAIKGQKLQLQLYCQAPGCWHPTESGGLYEITVPAEWFRVMAPYLRKLVKLLKYAHPVVGPTLGIGNPEVYERALSQDREYMQEIVANLPQLEGAEDLERVGGGMAEEFGLERLQGAPLRALRQLLDEFDPQQHWGGLRKVLTPEGHYLWLCEHHAQEYER